MVVQPSKIAYLTGSSKGIGRALADLLLQNGFYVVGFSRSNEIVHPHFEFRVTDLSNLEEVQAIKFDKEAEHVVLINNAGLIGEIGPVGGIDNQKIINTINVNTLAPQLLINKFIKRFKNDNGRFHLLNISSGAAQKAIDAWATYCASKAALDLFSETVADELDWRGQTNWRIHSCAPGVVDTAMQEQIRASNEATFKRVQNFKDLKSNNELSTPEQVATKLFQLIQSPNKYPDVVLSVRDF